MPTAVNTTVRSSGGDYATLSLAAADNFGATGLDLVSNDENIVCEMGNDWTGDGLDDRLVISGFTTDATRNIVFRAMAGHGCDGTLNSGARWYQDSAGTSPALDVSDEYVTIGGEGRGVQVQNQRPNQPCFFMPTGCHNFLFDSGIFYHPDPTVAVFQGIATTVNGNEFRNTRFIRDGTNASTYIVRFEGYSCAANNCSFEHHGTGTVSFAASVRSSGAWTMKNCTLLNVGGGTMTNYWQSSSGWTASSTHNATPNSTDDAPGGSSQTSVSSSDLVDTTDCVPTSSGKLQAGNGTDLSGTFNYDISGASRSASFTIGPWNESAGGGGTTVNASTKTLTLSEQTASIAHNRNVSAGPATKSLTTYQSTVATGTSVQAQTASKTLSTHTATLAIDAEIQAGVNALTITPNAATIAYGTNVQAGTATKTLAEQAATVTLDRAITGNLLTKTLLTYDASISTGGQKGGWGVDHDRAYLQRLRYQQGVAKDDDEVLAVLIASGLFTRR